MGLLLAESGWWAERVGEHFPPDLHSDAELARPLALGRSETDRSQAEHESVMALLVALGFAPDVLDWAIARLSTGERQRLALARLLANRPEALLLDEPTANHDPTNRDHVEQLILDYRQQQGAAVLWVSHDPEQRARLAALTGARRLRIEAGALRAEAETP